MLAGRPHEAVGNGSPRWMTVAPRKRGHRTRPTGRLTPLHLSDPWRNGPRACLFRRSGGEGGGVYGSSSEVFGVREEMAVGVHRLADRRKT
jgi:hypothetical protein